MLKRSLWVLALILGSALAFAAGCNAGSDSAGGAASGQGANGTGATGSGGNGQGGECIFCTGGSGQGGGINGTLVVTPPSVTLDIVNGAIVTQAFTATLNGNDVSGQVTWGFDKLGMGSMGGSVFTPTGVQGGVGTLTAKLNDSQATALITVNVTTTVNPGNVDTSGFDAPNGGSDPSVSFVYPYPDTVMPLRVASPEFQWNGGGAGDVYRLRLSAQHITYTVYLSAPPPSVHALDQQSWENVQFSTDGPNSDPLHVELERKSGGTVYSPISLTLHIAQGFIYGAIYYWELPDACGTGAIKRVRADVPTTETFYNTGACWGCHTVSRDGTELAASFDTGFPFPIQTIDLTTTPAGNGAVTQGMVYGTFSAYNADGSRLMTSNDGASALVQVVNTANGAITNGSLFAGDNCGEPAWSPDGTKVAAICGLNSWSWVFDASNGNLVVGTMNGDTASGVTTIVPQGALPGRPAYPSFSPDSQYLAYGRPTYGSRSIGNGTLWLTDIAGQSPKQLVQAANDNLSYNPVFAPKQAGGYTWIVFMSKRDYGNQLVGASRQQLWVAAIDDPPSAADPSHPAFYVRGQENCSLNENAYYALEPCKADGEDCTHGVECCNKSCVNGVCGEQIVGQCIPTNSGVCTADTDCCDYTGAGSNVTCIAGFCEMKPPQ
ncbi:MAG: PD40 domain-containing protein [Polyangiaceae bacterium]|nr:PD40 domain-containing protein [Polyangiaceae bacterium]